MSGKGFQLDWTSGHAIYRGAILIPNELVLTFRGSYFCANFCENRSRNATVRVLADGQTHTHTLTVAYDFIICPVL